MTDSESSVFVVHYGTPGIGIICGETPRVNPTTYLGNVTCDRCRYLVAHPEELPPLRVPDTTIDE